MTTDAQLAPRRQPLHALTGARFLAALAVVFYHHGRGALAEVAGGAATAAAAGPLAVSFFYVLSGAVLTWGCTAPDGAPARRARAFWGDRATRIVPTYLLALLLSLPTFSVHVVRMYPGAEGGLRVLAGLLSSALLLQAFWPPLVALNTPGWSISCEAFFYALWPRLVRRLRPATGSFPLRGVLACWSLACAPGILALIWFARAPAHLPWSQSLVADVPAPEMVSRFIAYLPPLRLAEFAMGIILGHALKSTKAHGRSTAADTGRELALTGAILAAATAIGVGAKSGRPDLAFAAHLAAEGPLLAGVFALLVWQLARGRGILVRFLSLRPLRALGEASFAVYILQEPVFVWISAVLKRAAPEMLLHESRAFWGSTAVLVGGSLLVHRAFEVPIRAAFLRRAARDLPAPLPAGI